MLKKKFKKKTNFETDFLIYFAKKMLKISENYFFYAFLKYG